MQQEHKDPKSDQSPQRVGQGEQQQGNRPGQGRPMDPTRQGQNPNERQGDDDRDRKHGKMDNDEGKVGQDTDGDGKVVKPGQRPGQSGGHGLPGNK